MTKRVWEVCEPHPDVFAREMDPSMFAASLHAVESGTADQDYTDPERFFAKTFMTRSLENVLGGVSARLAGQPEGGAPVLRLETPFGGGKTHTMVALYHLAKSPEAAEATGAGQRLSEQLNQPHLPRNVRVVVLDGVSLDVRGRPANGRTILTLWGELADRLGFYEAVRDADQARTPPGQAKLAEMLRQAQPVLILMDEVMDYLARARAVRVGDSNLMEQTASFLRALTSAVVETPQAVLVLSLPASSLEIPVDDRAQAERMFQHMRNVLGRTELIETPVTQDEVFGVLKQRLFRSIGTEQQAKRVVGAFYDYYADYARFFPERLRTPQYRERMQKAYPFHPELVDLLYQRWGPHPQFQRTRGALRLLALVLRRIWHQRPGSAFLIQPHHIDLADRYIRAEVVRLLDSAFDTIATGDVMTRAREIDRDLGGDYQREELAKGASTCAFLYSISPGREFVGLTEEDLRIALLRPDMNPALLSEVLGRLRTNLWYLRHRDQRYFFMAKPNLNKVILDYEQGIAEEKVDERIAESLRAVSGVSKTDLQVLVAPASEEAVGEPSKATLVLLPLHISDPQQWMKRVVDRTTRRSLLFFLVPEKDGNGRLRAIVKRLLALEAVQKAGLFREMDREDRGEVQNQFKDKQAELEGLLFSLYNRVFRPSPDGVQELRVHLRRDAKTIAEAVETALKEQGVLIAQLSPDYLRDKVMGGKDEIPVVQVETVLTCSPDHPVPLNPQQVIQQAIREGVKQGQFTVVVGNQVVQEEVTTDILRRPDAKIVIGPVSPVPQPPLSPSPTSAILQLAANLRHHRYPLKRILEWITELPDSVAIEMKVQGDFGSKRTEIDALLKDYDIPFTWDEV